MAKGKKARSAKQKANDKRLGQMARARAAARKSGVGGMKPGRRKARKGQAMPSMIYGPGVSSKPRRKKAKKRHGGIHSGGSVPVFAGKRVVTGQVIGAGKTRQRLEHIARPAKSKSAKLARKALARKGPSAGVVLHGFMRRKRSKAKEG